MVEVPENDERWAQLAQCRDLLFVALGNEAELPSCLQHIIGFTAIAGDAAGHAQLFQWDEATVITEYDSQGCRATLHGFHLQHGGSPNPSLLLKCGGDGETARSCW